MRNIASLIAVPFALLVLHANGPIVAAPVAQNHTNTPTQSITETAPAPAAPEQPPAAPSPVVITVQPGDTLTSIASANGTTYKRLFDGNDFISNPDIINVGDKITVPSNDAQLPDRAIPTPAPAKPAASSPVRTASSTVPKATPVVAPAGDDGSAKAYIYSRESGNNPNATNSTGCYGIGQDCSGRVRATCGADYACQDAYFTNYATSRYGSWEGALAFWQTHRWW